MEFGEKSKVGLSPDFHNAWEPAQNAGFHIPPATAAAGTIKANAAEQLESRGFPDSRAEPFFAWPEVVVPPRFRVWPHVTCSPEISLLEM
jgi:hypothetical protein